MKREYKVSIIVPVYNVDEYLEETLNSIMKQTMEDFELILVNDGSKDNSLKICKEYEEKFENIKVINQENSGAGAARNKGIENAIGEYIIFVDGDDVLPEDSVEVRYKVAEREKSDLVICSTYKFFQNEKWPLTNHMFSKGVKNLGTDNKDLLLTLGPCNKIYKRELIKNIKFPTELQYAEDQVFIIRAYLEAKKIYKTEYVGYFYRMRGDEGQSITQQVINNPIRVIKNIFNLYNIIDNDINRLMDNEIIKKDFKFQYFDRLVQYDLWPALNQAIKNKNYKEQIEVFEILMKLIDNIDKDTLSSCTRFTWCLTNGVVERYLYLNSKSSKVYSECIGKVYEKLDFNALYVQESRNRELFYAIKKDRRISIYFYLIKRNLLKRSVGINNRLGKLVFHLSKLIPVNKNKIILASNKSVTLQDNLKSIADELEKHKNLEVKVYLNLKRDLREILSMYYNLGTAKCILLDDYYRQLYGVKIRKSTEVIQVWHACGAFKKFGYSSIGKADGNTLEFENNAHSIYTRVVTSSKYINKYYAEAFNINEDRILPFGVPRTDKLCDEKYTDDLKSFLDIRYPELKNKKMILYAPTFRGGPSERHKFELKLDPIKLLRSISDEYVIAFKLHPSVKTDFSKELDIPVDLKNRILFFNSSVDVNDLVIKSDIVVTDYSSVVFEAALLNKKILMFAYDKEEYLKERDFYFEYDKFVPGPIAYNTDDIIKVIKENKFDNDKVEDFKNKFFDNNKNGASKRIVKFILER